MTPVRAGVSMLLVGAICLVVVALRVERVRCESRTQMHMTKLINYRRALWNMQVEMARLRAPQQIRDRVERMELVVCAPCDRSIFSSSSRQYFAANRR